MVGTDAMNVTDLEKPTMVLSLRAHSPDIQRSLVIHEFGHALGLEHEHQRSDFWDVLEKHFDLGSIKEDKRLPQLKDGQAAFGKDWSRLKGNTDLDVARSDYDPNSIMHYW